MAKAKSLLADITASVRNHRPGFRAWFELLPDAAQQELGSVREAFHAGKMPGVQKRALARAVMEAAKDRGWKTSGIQGVLAWLDARNDAAS